MTVWMIGLALVEIAGCLVAIFLWDDIVDLMNGLKRRGHRKAHDVERTVRMHAPVSRASARARVPRQRGPRHRR